MSIYEFTDYKKYINAWIDGHANGGHGEYRRLATALDVSTTLISQVFKGDKNLSLEMGCELAEYLQLDEAESEYLILLIEHSKAGSHKLLKKFEKQIKTRQEKFNKLENRVKNTIELSEETKAIFYSSWMYSAVRLLTDIEGMNNATLISNQLMLPKNQIQKILDFLNQNGLVILHKNNYSIGPARTFIGSSNHLVAKHHQNWRLQGFQKMIQTNDENFFYTAPMVLSKEVAEKIRQELPQFIEKIIASVRPSKSEQVRCLNIDWFVI